MTRKIIQQRKRIYLAVEGEGEQSFIKWLQQLCDQNGLHVHLDCEPLGGGGYKTMLNRAVQERKRKERNKAKYSILLVDADRAERGDDGWSLLQLKQEASKSKINVCVQNPNQEGLLVRMMPGNESLQSNIASASSTLNFRVRHHILHPSLDFFLAQKCSHRVSYAALFAQEKKSKAECNLSV